MKLSPRELFLLMLVLIVGCCASYYNYVYVPITDQISAGELEISQLVGEYSRLLTWQAEALQTEERIEEVTAELEGWVKDAKAVGDNPQVLVFLETESDRLDVRMTSIRISGRQASLTFDTRSYSQTRLFLQELERMMAFEVVRARYGVPAGGAVDASFDITLHIGAADETVGLEPRDRTDPFTP